MDKQESILIYLWIAFLLMVVFLISIGLVLYFTDGTVLIIEKVPCYDSEGSVILNQVCETEKLPEDLDYSLQYLRVGLIISFTWFVICTMYYISESR